MMRGDCRSRRHQGDRLCHAGGPLLRHHRRHVPSHFGEQHARGARHVHVRQRQALRREDVLQRRVLATKRGARQDLRSERRARRAEYDQARFICSGGKSIAATFVNGAQGSVKLVLSDGRTLILPQGLSGSGARYTNSDESVVFWNKGNTATLDEKGKPTYDGCATKG